MRIKVWGGGGGREGVSLILEANQIPWNKVLRRKNLVDPVKIKGYDDQNFSNFNNNIYF